MDFCAKRHLQEDRGLAPDREVIRGAGLGLRAAHYRHILERKPKVGWFEILSENYFAPGGQPHFFLERIRTDYPVVLHGIGLSIGSADPLNEDYLARLRALRDRYQPAWVSDHLSWVSLRGEYYPDLYPLPYTETSLKHVTERVRRVQDILGERILLENISHYLLPAAGEIPEGEYLAALAENADCYLLLDVNNLYVNAANSGSDPLQSLAAIPPSRVRQIHLAGHEVKGSLRIDTHGAPIAEPVWELFRKALKHFGAVPSCVERDQAIPVWEELYAEYERVDLYLREACGHP